MPIGLISNFWLLIIGMFLFFASGSELNVAKIGHALKNLKIGAIAIRNFSYVNESMSLLDFLRLIAKPEQRYYPIVNSERKIIGVLDIQDLNEIEEKNLSKKVVKDLAKKFDVINAENKIKEKIHEVLSKEFMLVVSDDKEVIGYLTPQYVLEIARFYGMLHNRLRRK